MLGPRKSEEWPGNIQTLPYKPEIGRDWRDKIQTLPYRY